VQIVGIKVTATGIEHLKRMASLNSQALRQAKVTEEGKEKFCEALPS
jgi:hypothetical protein